MKTKKMKNELDFLIGKSVLHLPITNEFFNMIALGIKKEEYRAIKPYWFVRLVFKTTKISSKIWSEKLVTGQEDFASDFFKSNIKKFDYVFFKNGYSKNAPVLITEWKGMDVGTAKPEWSNNWQGKVFRIYLGKINYIKH